MDASTFKKIRMILGLSQDELAQQMGISLNYIGKMEAGTRNISDKQCNAIIDLMIAKAKTEDKVLQAFKAVLNDPNIAPAELQKIME